MDKFIIQGGVPLNGEVTPSGNKNAALPLLAACILTDEPVILHNVPEINDVKTMRELLVSIGVKVTQIKDHSWKIHAKEIYPENLDPDLCCRIRASILLAGPVTARTGDLKLPPPGGDVIGKRRVDTHILALKALGVETTYHQDQKLFQFSGKKLKGADILLDEASVTATENAIMAAVLADGKIYARNSVGELVCVDVSSK